MLKVGIILCVLFFSVSCASPLDREIARLSAESSQWAAELEARRRVNDNWSADCVVDQVTGVRRCFTATFGQAMDFEGNGYGPKNLPFQIFYYDNEGPFVQVGLHTYPGRRPTVRVDDNEPVTVWDSAGVEHRGKDQELVELLLSGTVARARYHVWPDGPQDMIVDLTGISEAWERLQELIRNPPIIPVVRQYSIQP